MSEHCSDHKKWFYKEPKLIDIAKVDPEACLREVLQTFELHDLINELDEWQRIALCNDQGIYQEGWQRRDLMDFCKSLKLLISCLYLLNIPTATAEVKQKAKKYLSPDQIANPQKMVMQFCNTFSESYIISELWDLLEAVISYEGEKDINPGYLLLYYQCLVGLAITNYRNIR